MEEIKKLTPEQLAELRAKIRNANPDRKDVQAAPAVEQPQEGGATWSPKISKKKIKVEIAEDRIGFIGSSLINDSLDFGVVMTINYHVI